MRYLLLNSTAATVWWSVLLLTAIFFVAWKVPSDPDLFWHVRAGQDIVQQGVPHTDWYTHTAPDFPWVNHEYAQDVLIGWLHDLGGFELLAIVYTVVVLATFSLGLMWAMPRLTPWPVVLGAGFAVTLLSRAFIGTRPQMYTYVFLLLLLGLLWRAGDTRRWAGWVWFVPLLFVLWANWHGSFVLGLVTLAIILAVETALMLVPWLRERATPHTTARRLRIGWLALGVSVAATLLTPYGGDLWVEALRTIGDTELHRNIVEWFSPNVRNTNGAILFSVASIAVLTMVLRKKAVDVTGLILSLAYAWAALLSVRNVPLFLVLVVPFVVQTAYHWAGPTLRTALRTWPVLVMSSLIVVMLTWLVPIRTLVGLNQSDQWLIEAGYPVGAATYMQSHPELAKTPSFHPYGWGGYLLYAVPEFATFIDGRMPSWEQNGVKYIDDFFTIDRLEDGWPNVIERYEIGVALLPIDHQAVSALIGHGFIEVYRDTTAVILTSTPSTP